MQIGQVSTHLFCNSLLADQSSLRAELDLDLTGERLDEGQGVTEIVRSLYDRDPDPDIDPHPDPDPDQGPME